MRVYRWKFFLFSVVFMSVSAFDSVDSIARDQPVETVKVNHAYHVGHLGTHHQKHVGTHHQKHVKYIEHRKYVQHVSHSSSSALMQALNQPTRSVYHPITKAKLKHVSKGTVSHTHVRAVVPPLGHNEKNFSQNSTHSIAAIDKKSQSIENEDSTSLTLFLERGKGRTITLNSGIARLFVVDPSIVKVRSAGQRSFFAFGIKSGVTVVEALSVTGKVLARYTVTVTPSEYSTSFLKGGVATKTPHVTIKPLPGDGVALDGEAPNPEAAQKLVERAHQIVGANGYVDDYMKVPMSVQVNLQVRIVEMDRKLVRDFGIDWQNVVQLGNAALVGVIAAHANPAMAIQVPESGGTINKLFDALASDGLVRNLAQPNLTTISGQPASFLVGGEFPVPISNYTGTPMISFKPYGVSLSFVPTVLANGQISLHVRPSVSQLNYQNSVSVTSMNTKSTLQIPGISVRSADTTVELGSGQSFAIAGLLQDVAQMNTSGMPWLKNIPILGALFKSSQFQDQETELVIIVTPYLVKPVNNIRELHTPDQTWRWPQGVDQVFLMHQSQTDTSKRPPWQKVDANNVGFIME